MVIKKLYVTTKDTWAAHAKHLNGKPMVHHAMKERKPVRDPITGLWKVSDPEYIEIPIKHTDLFNPATGSHFIEVGEGQILVATCLEHSEYNAEIWHSLPEVARLPHPIYEGNVPMKHVLENAEHLPKRFRRKHMNALKNHSRLEFNEMDSVIDLSRKAKRIKPDVCIGI